METRKLKLEFPLTKLSVPVFTKLVTDFDVSPNVLAADIEAAKGGWLLIKITGEPVTLDHALDWVLGNDIKVSAA